MNSEAIQADGLERDFRFKHGSIEEIHNKLITKELRIKKGLSSTGDGSMCSDVNSNQELDWMNQQHQHHLRELLALPSLATPAQVAEVLQVTPRCVRKWKAEKRIRAALDTGKVIRISPYMLALDLGLIESVEDATSPENGDDANGGKGTASQESPETAVQHRKP